ncbi:hypothetical protein [Amycolatopsis sp. Poz14]|uniref:hypothetical protein n=1 Tax=Amycolatopsis sp. Poz14 TaxID=1447705 RepID=UPI001EE918E4|nr:hypothetical protein [Amycolatopsis sp. Poz14]MCG3757378.1 hypothetical protein [Amycolatopsis sp. Poz14]
MSEEGDDMAGENEAPSTLLDAVRTTCKALELGSEQAARVRVAELLAATVDEMSAEQRARLLGQTVPPLLRVLEQLTASAPKGGKGVDGPAESPKRARLRALRAEHDERTGTD